MYWNNENWKSGGNKFFAWQIFALTTLYLLSQNYISRYCTRSHSKFYTIMSGVILELQAKLSKAFTESFSLEKTSKTDSSLWPLWSRPLHSMPYPVVFLSMSRDGNSSITLGSLSRCLTTLSVEKFFLRIPFWNGKIFSYHTLTMLGSLTDTESQQQLKFI